MPKNVTYSIWIRKGDSGGAFEVEDQETRKLFGEMCAIAKGLVDKGDADEAVVLESRVVQRFRKYEWQG